MQKKIIALAVAGLVSGAAFAQVAPNNVTLYGIVDMGYLFQGQNVATGGDNYSGIDAGGWDGSRFGFNGTEDLGNGLTIGFNTEFDFGTDFTSGGISVAKNSLFLSGKNWGTVKAGSFGNAIDDIAGFSESGGMGWGNGVVGLKINDSNYNAVKYISPSFSGFQFNAAYSTNNANSQDTAASGTAQDANLKAWDLGAQYVNGGLKVGFGYEGQDKDSTDFDSDAWVIAAGYNFGQFQLGAGYSDYSQNTAGYDVDRQSWAITGGFDFTAVDHIAVSYTASNLDTDAPAAIIGMHDNYDTDAFGISYHHAMSKRTNIYVSAYQADAKYGFVGVNDYGNPTTSGFETAFKFGIRHLF